MTLVIPIFLIMYWVGLIDTIVGVMLVIVTLELPFSIFIMKGFFDSVAWDIEMSAITDGASRRQAFFLVVLPQVRVGLIAIGVFAFIKGWEEYVFVRTLLIEKSNWVMSLYLYWVADDIMGVDYGIVAAVSVVLCGAQRPPVPVLPEVSDPTQHRRRKGIAAMARIDLEGISKSWGDVVAVEPTDLLIEDGDFVAILGPSGCGKSTTLFMLAGIYAPSSGRVLFDGMAVNEVEAKDRNVGIVFQSYALYPHMSVRENIMFPLKFKNIARTEAVRRTEETARLVHVEEFLDRRPAQLSGGQQQRVALARALVKEPQLLLLDEPLSNLDATLRLSMRTEIKALQRRMGVTAILVTHDQIEATTMADRIICMSRGRIEQVGSPDDLLPSAGIGVRRLVHRGLRRST